MTNIRALPGVIAPTTQPNEVLIRMLEDMLRDAKSGAVQSFVGTGFQADGLRLAFWCPDQDVYKMLGALTWLQHEYVYRITS